MSTPDSGDIPAEVIGTPESLNVRQYDARIYAKQDVGYFCRVDGLRPVGPFTGVDAYRQARAALEPLADLLDRCDGDADKAQASSDYNPLVEKLCPPR